MRPSVTVSPPGEGEAFVVVVGLEVAFAVVAHDQVADHAGVGILLGTDGPVLELADQQVESRRKHAAQGRPYPVDPVVRGEAALHHAGSEGAGWVGCRTGVVGTPESRMSQYMAENMVRGRYGDGNRGTHIMTQIKTARPIPTGAI